MQTASGDVVRGAMSGAEGAARLFAGTSDVAVALAGGLVSLPVLERLAGFQSAPDQPTPLLLLPPAYEWTDREARPQVPLPLCEFLAYKAVLAYEAEKTIESNLPGATDFRFFDCALTDTQGYGFRYQGMAFVVLRGTQEKADWDVNLSDALTDAIFRARQNGGSRELAKLQKRYKDKVFELVGDPSPARHTGFALGWGGIRQKVEDWIAPFSVETPFVFSGHSLGGALALIGAHEFAARGHRIAAVVTFGAPQVGTGEFAASYKEQGLAGRTICLEASGDSVPRLMRRWYYVLGASARQRISEWVQSQSAPPTDTRYALAGGEWIFSEQPPVDRQELEAAIRAARRDAEERARKAAEGRDDKNKNKSATSSEPNSGTPESQGKPAGETAPADPGKTQGTTQSKPSDGGDGRIVLLIVVGIFAAIAALAAWMFVRRKIASHSIMERYALYLSTLSYQQIRALRDGDLQRANDDLVHYLRFIRGDRDRLDRNDPPSYFERYRALPVQLKPDDDIKEYMGPGKTGIC